jgi:hypothetical protein
MSFDPTTITEVYPPKRSGAGVKIAWESSSPAGTIFQVYINRTRAWSGAERSVTLHVPAGASIDIGAVEPGEALTDFSASLSAIPETRVTLTWTGGLFEGSDLSGFRVYGESHPGGGIDYTAPLGDIQAYVEGAESDGFGMGGFGEGGFGASAGSYSWTSTPLTGGTWNFVVVPYDMIGNEGEAAAISQTVIAPPGPPKRDGDGSRLTYTYDPETYKATLNWLESETA